MGLFTKSKLKDKLAAKNSGFRHVLVEVPDFDNAKFMVFEPPLKDWMAYVSVVKACSDESSLTEDEKATKLIEAEAKLFIKCVRDENGDVVFAESELKDLIAVFGNNHSRIVERGLELLTLKQSPLEIAEKSTSDDFLRFRLKLALRLGKALDELDKTMPASELYLWIAYDQTSPIGDERSDINSAQIASSVLQSKGAKVTTSDMIIKWKVTEQDETKDAHDFFKSIQKAQRNG